MLENPLFKGNTIEEKMSENLFKNNMMLDSALNSGQEGLLYFHIDVIIHCKKVFSIEDVREILGKFTRHVSLRFIHLFIVAKMWCKISCEYYLGLKRILE